jgi:hypothetical protein
MTGDRIDQIIVDYERGALTCASACLEVLLAAGEGDAEAVFARLTPELRNLVSRDVAGANAEEAGIIESYCGTPSPEAYAADLRHREEILRRGIAAVQRLTSGGRGEGDATTLALGSDGRDKSSLDSAAYLSPELAPTSASPRE